MAVLAWWIPKIKTILQYLSFATLGSIVHWKLAELVTFEVLPAPVPVAGAGDADPKNQKYIAIPFICHLRERSVTTQSWVIQKQIFAGARAGCRCRCRRCRPQKSKLYCNTFHLPPSGALCDHPELSYSKKKLLVPVAVAGSGASDADPKNQKYIAIPFICHLQEHSVTT